MDPTQVPMLRRVIIIKVQGEAIHKKKGEALNLAAVKYKTIHVVT
jgi:hypothetical protein